MKASLQQQPMYCSRDHNYPSRFNQQYEKSTQEIPFLDTIIYRTKDNQLFTKVYHKPTDQKQYLHFQSAHPRKQKESVPYGLLIRTKRICSEEKHFEEEARHIIQQLKLRKYPPILLQEAYTKVKNMNREDLLRPSTPKTNNKIRLITNYNPNNPDLRSVLRKHETLLLLTRKPAIKPEDIDITYNKSPSIRDMLVKSSLHKQPTTNLCQPCYKPRSKTCQQISTTQTITNQVNHSYKI